jgi:NIMA-interacting peptidyl-prolyl cis-trans isomerase 1
MADQVRTAHLLIKHTGSRNPVSRRTGEQVTLSPDQALAELQSYETRINSEGVAAAFPKYGRCKKDDDDV